MTAPYPLPKAALGGNGRDDSPIPSPMPEAPPLDEHLVARALVELRDAHDRRFDILDAAIERARVLAAADRELATRRHDHLLATVGRTDAKVETLADEVRAGFRHLTHRDSQHDEGLEAARAEAAKAHTIATDAKADARRALVASAKAIAIGAARVTAIVALLRGLLWVEQHLGLFR